MLLNKECKNFFYFRYVYLMMLIPSFINGMRYDLYFELGIVNKLLQLPDEELKNELVGYVKEIQDGEDSSFLNEKDEIIAVCGRQKNMLDHMEYKNFYFLHNNELKTVEIGYIIFQSSYFEESLTERLNKKENFFSECSSSELKDCISILIKNKKFQEQLHKLNYGALNIHLPKIPRYWIVLGEGLKECNHQDCDNKDLIASVNVQLTMIFSFIVDKIVKERAVKGIEMPFIGSNKIIKQQSSNHWLHFKYNSRILIFGGLSLALITIFILLKKH